MLQTENLYLRNLRMDDVPVIHAYRNDPQCARYQRWEDVSLAAVQAFVSRFENSTFLSEEEEQHYAVCLRCGDLVGDVSYFYTERDRCVTLGITIAPQYQRRGIAREILTSLTAAVRSRYPQLDMVALIDPENEGSIRLFESLGFYRECYAESIRSYVYVIYAAV